MENPSYGLGRACRKAKGYGLTTIGSPHGNQNFGGPHAINLGSWLDYSFLFGRKECLYYKDRPIKLLPTGIPSADSLVRMEIEPKHILVVPNFLGFRKNSTPYCDFTFTPEFVEKIGLRSLQQELQLPVVVKVKPRFDEKRFHGKDWSPG